MEQATTPSHESSSLTHSYHETAELFINHFGKFFGVTVIPGFITYLLGFSLKMSFFSSFFTLQSWQDFFSFGNIHFVVSAALLLTMTVVQGIGMIALFYMVVHHERVSVLASFEHALEFFWRFVGMGLVVMAVTIMGLVVGYAAVILLGAPLSSYSTDIFDALFSWLGLIPFFLSTILSSFFVFTGFCIVEDNMPVAKGLRTSFSLVRKHFWSAIAHLFVLYLFTGTLLFILNFIPGIGNLLGLICVIPFSVVYLYLLYTQFKNR